MAREHLVLTVIGPDKRGTVANITEVVLENKANIKESRMARLGGEFAVLMLLSIPENNRKNCLDNIELLEDQGLTTFVKQTDFSRLDKFKGFVPYEISAWGADHEGIVHSIAEYLASERVNVETMDTNVYKAPLTGTPIFSMQAIVQAPAKLTLQKMRTKLQDVGEDLGVDVEVKIPID